MLFLSTPFSLKQKMATDPSQVAITRDCSLLLCCPYQLDGIFSFLRDKSDSNLACTKNSPKQTVAYAQNMVGDTTIQQDPPQGTPC